MLAAAIIPVGTRGEMEIQKVLLLLVASWLCCDAADDRSKLFGVLLRGYEKDAEPPLADGVTNTTVTMSFTLLCATPVGDFVSIESWTSMVSRAAVGSRHIRSRM